MGRRAKTDDERMEEWLATASVESLKRFNDLVRFALTMRTTTAKPIKPSKEDPQATLPGVKP
jgi:hypothetical protein